MKMTPAKKTEVNKTRLKIAVLVTWIIAIALCLWSDHVHADDGVFIGGGGGSGASDIADLTSDGCDDGDVATSDGAGGTACEAIPAVDYGDVTNTPTIPAAVYDVTVCASGCDYTDLSEGQAAAGASSLVYVGPGTYDESGAAMTWDDDRQEIVFGPAVTIVLGANTLTITGDHFQPYGRPEIQYTGTGRAVHVNADYYNLARAGTLVMDIDWGGNPTDTPVETTGVHNVVMLYFEPISYTQVGGTLEGLVYENAGSGSSTYVVDIESLTLTSFTTSYLFVQNSTDYNDITIRCTDYSGATTRRGIWWFSSDYNVARGVIRGYTSTDKVFSSGTGNNSAALAG